MWCLNTKNYCLNKSIKRFLIDCNLKHTFKIILSLPHNKKDANTDGKHHGNNRRNKNDDCCSSYLSPFLRKPKALRHLCSKGQKYIIKKKEKEKKKKQKSSCQLLHFNYSLFVDWSILTNHTTQINKK